MLHPSIELLAAVVLLGLVAHAAAWRNIAAHREENDSLRTMLRSWTRFANPTLLPGREAPLCRRVLHVAAREGYEGRLDPRSAFDHIVQQLQKSAEAGHAVGRQLAGLERELAQINADSQDVSARIEDRSRELKKATQRLDRALARRAAGQKAG